jgi:hypothetical protein
VGGKLDWIEHHPLGDWRPIGGWRTRAIGLYVAGRLIAGTHFWDGELKRCRLYNDDVYAEIRESQEAGQ